ncbi:MAG: tetratricopeptide repeat protein, partial [Nannocystaceae bacterium]
ALASRSIEAAVALGHAPTEADARLARGWVLTDQGELVAAETELREALHAAEAGHHDTAVALAWNRLAWVVGYKAARHDEGRRLAEHAEAWGRRLGPDPEAELSRLRTQGWIDHDAGRAQAALEHFERALAVADRLPAGDAISSEELALVHNGLGAAALGIADLPRAADSFGRAAELLEAQLGPDHPDVAKVRNNLASLLRAQGQSEAALRLLLHNLEVFEATFGEAHPLVGQTLINVAVAELDLGRHDSAERHAERGIAVLSAAHGPRHPMVAKAHTLRGDARVQLQRPREAIEDFELALELELETLGEDHPSLGIIESNLGGAYYDLDQLDEAAEHQVRAIDLLTEGLGDDHPNVAFVVLSLGLTRGAQGRVAEALPLFQRAEQTADASLLPNAKTRVGEVLVQLGRLEPGLDKLEQAYALYGDIEHDPGFFGDTCLALARARWATGHDRSGALDMAQQAIDAYTEGGDTELEAEARRWLAAHAPSPG